MTYLEIGRTYGGVAHSQNNRKYVSALLIAYTDHGGTERFTSSSLDDVSWVQRLLHSCREGICHSSTCPGMSLHMISFTRPSLVLALQVTNAGVRRSRYDAICDPWPRIGILFVYLLGCWCTLFWWGWERPGYRNRLWKGPNFNEHSQDGNHLSRVEDLAKIPANSK